MLRAILFDFNGVLVDDEPVHLQLVVQVLEEEGMSLGTDDYLSRFGGLSDRACFATALREAGLEPEASQIDRLVARKAGYYQEVMRQQGVPLFPGAVDLIRTAGRAGMMLGIVSGALRDEIEEVLAQSDLQESFKCVVAAEDVERSKPDPEGYRLGLDRLNSMPPLPQRLLHPHEVLAVEDTPRGVRAAHSAGLVTLALAQTFSRDQLSTADHVADGLGGLSFGDLQRLFAEASSR